MLIVKNIYRLLTTFSFHLSLKNYFLYFKSSTGYNVMRVFNNFWVKSVADRSQYLKFYNRLDYLNFFRCFGLVYTTLYNFYFFKLQMKGLGFRIRRISKRLYKFFFICVNFFYLYIPKQSFLKIKGRKLFFTSSNLCQLRLLIVHLLLLKQLSVYRTRGFVYPRQIFIMKPGKKRF